MCFSLRASAAVHNQEHSAEFQLEFVTYGRNGYTLATGDWLMNIHWHYVVSGPQAAAMASVGKHHIDSSL